MIKKMKPDNKFIGILSAVLILVFFVTMYLMKVYKSEALEYSIAISKMSKQSSSTEVDSIEQDLENTDLSNLDKELQDIESELSSIE